MINNQSYDYKKALFVIVIVGLLQAVYNSFLPIYVDEAYYWVWGLRPDWSYYDHPAMVAWLIYPFTFIGDSEFVIRLSTVLCMSVTAWYLFRIGYEVVNRYTGFIVLFIFITIPAVQMGYCFITPDSPLMMFWAMGLYYTYLALDKGLTKYFVISGFVTGFMMLSKYTGLLFPVSVFIYILIYRRSLLKDYRLWLAVFIAAICVMPIFYWNYQHDWISITFQYNHGTSSGLTFAGWDFVGFVLGSLFVIPTPVFGYVYLKYIFNKGYKENQNIIYLYIVSIVPLLFFFYKGIFKKMELNWIIPAFISGIVLIGIAINKYSMKKSYKYGLIVSILLSIILKISPMLPVPPNLNIADRLLGYREAINIASKYIQDGDLVFSNHLTTASMLTFYLKDHPIAHINVPSRFSQYTLWDKEYGFNLYNKEGVYIGRHDAFNDLIKHYWQVIPLDVISIKPFNAREKRFYVYRCIPYDR